MGAEGVERRKAQTVLVVEDDVDVRSLLAELFGRAGYQVVEADDGRAALRELYERAPDLVVLDLLPPPVDGWQALERIRDVSAVPVLVLSARAGEVEKVRALRAGADDYVTKPFGRQELVARVDALLRRSVKAPKDDRRYADAVLSVDVVARRVEAEGREVALTPLEFRVLSALVERPGRVLTHEELLERAWGTTRGVSPEQVRLYVGYVRRKLGGRAADAIETVRGFGYRYRPPVPG